MRLVRATAVLFVLSIAAAAQGAYINRDKQMALRPPTGQKVAIVMFEDMQCPDCARAHAVSGLRAGASFGL
jgi:AhpD family alkylhydroperoxidase